jgi:hypothetical protein
MIKILLLASLMVGLTVLIHFGGLLVLLRLLRNHGAQLRSHASQARPAAVIMVVVLALMGIHTIEVWAYALAYLAIGALGDLESALYFSTVSFTSLGYGDIVLDRQWRLLGAIEAANGLLLFGWSTAFLISVIDRMRVLGGRPSDAR